MPVTEQPGFGASDDNHTNRFSPTEKWDGQYSAEAKASGTVAALRVLVIFGLQISHLDRFAVDEGTTDDIDMVERLSVYRQAALQLDIADALVLTVRARLRPVRRSSPTSRQPFAYRPVCSSSNGRRPPAVVFGSR